MPHKVNLLFGVHNHQPVGNFEHIFKKATEDCYRPFIDVLYNYPQIKSTIHFSGSLIDWLLKNAPEVLQKVKKMVKRQQAEILTGAYYEPVLPVIPERDRIGQINMLNEFIRGYFDYQPRGMWLGERVWGPELLRSLTQLDIRYILLDDFHFTYSGIKKKDLWGYYMTGEGNQRLAVFPIAKNLRYLIPFARPSQVLAYLKGLISETEEKAAIIVDDGEKFGLWPGTHKWVYQKKWLENFFQLLVKNKDWLRIETISEYMGRCKPLGFCRLNAASYEEMMQWSGGCFRNFFSKYPEANNLHKRMLYLSEKLSKHGSEDERASRLLYRGQCNCPYWHGVFGGIYSGHLRRSAYKNLIQAQALIEKKKGPRWIESEIFDFNADGEEEIIINNPLLAVFVAPAQGGGIFELDYKPGEMNLLDVMTRVPEAYHRKIKAEPPRLLSLRREEIKSVHDLLRSKESNLEDYLIYDSYRKISLLDHFLPRASTLEDFKALRHEELGDFINAQYSARQNEAKQGPSVVLEREGSINYNGKEMPLKISKELIFTDCDSSFSIDYKLENPSAEPLEVIFAVEFNLSLDCSSREDTEAEAIKEWRLKDKVSGVEAVFYFEQKPNLWAYPLETVSASAEGFERNWQQRVILFHWPIKIEKSWKTKITVAVSG